MGTINQTAPTSDVVQQNVSDSYFTQLLTSGSTAPIVWTTLVATPAFVVSSNGNLATSALLSNGSYTASGTMVDSLNNTGIWTFTLTVLTSTPTPQTTVIPSVPLAPTGIEVMIPFQFNPATGQLSTVNQYQIVISQHVLSVLLTAMGERVMLPTYGVGMQTYVFQPDSHLIGAQIQSSVISAMKTWEPSAIVQNVSVSQSATNPGVMNVTVQYSTPYSSSNTITVTLGGAIPTAPITTIGTFIP
jgi:uncharacterized protein